MSEPQPEFSRPLPVEDIGEGIERAISAAPAELRALARRMGLPAIHALAAELAITPEKRGGYLVRGRMRAKVAQECVRTLEVFDADVKADIERLFVPADSPAARALEQEQAEAGTVALDADAPDAPDIIRDGVIDLGELVAEHLALSLDPWPKKPGTDFIDMQAGAPPEEDGEEGAAHPFAALERLKRRD